MSGGRLILGVGAGYLKEEFEALGAPFEERGRVMDEALQGIRAAWTGDSVVLQGKHFNATGNTALPRPVQQPGPPIWIGGNTDQAIARAVRFADGWSPFPVSGGFSARVRTSEIASVADLKGKIDHMKQLCADAGRAPLDVCMVPFGSTMQTKQRPEAAALIDHLGELREAGVTWASISLGARTRAEYVENADWFAAEVAGRVT
jgi:alkanesulfonate monooxygenase SsuD/methylene tetrahydromethanopterin reductase-like flavin-dependent oxidoreductase (luciferase family)